MKLTKGFLNSSEDSDEICNRFTYQCIDFLSRTLCLVAEKLVHSIVVRREFHVWVPVIILLLFLNWSKDLGKLVHIQPLQREELNAAVQALSCPRPPWLPFPQTHGYFPTPLLLKGSISELPWSPLLASLTKPEVFNECNEIFWQDARPNYSYCYKSNFQYDKKKQALLL